MKDKDINVIKYNSKGYIKNIKCCPHCGELRQVGSRVYYCEVIRKNYYNKDLVSVEDYYKNKVRELIKCNGCDGVGGRLGTSLGYIECEICGGDGHRLCGNEGEKLGELLDNLT